ncbi:Eco57I restriction-modification methylase domain-containing protein [Streptococcus hyointestinalis]|uniref:Eco57I restriction-modification methylase domain-containing protein n=1 Tax=Streptococcus hyointestinalis TaxID=1337 RepID=UPI003F9974F7
MITNFEFLKVDDLTAELFQTANTAEKSYADKDYETTLFKARKLAEHCALLVADQEFVDVTPRMTFHQVLEVIKDKIDKKAVVNAFYDIKGKGNNAVHNLNSAEATQENALKTLKQVFYILVWFMKTYTFEEAQVEYLQFLEPEAQARYQAAERKFIYIQEADTSDGDLPRYEGKQKIGEGTIPEDDLEADWTANSGFLRQEAPKRIKQYMHTSGLAFNLGWVELAYVKANKTWFHDKDVHRVLLRSGVKRADKLEGTEWFECDLETAKKAIQAVKEGRSSIMAEIPTQKEPAIVLRPEQKAAVTQTKKVFKKKDRMLWNAKMRFGKTLTALQLVKDEAFQKVLILTHRPVVKDSWAEDFDKMQMTKAGYLYGSDSKGETIENLKKGDKPFVYFASIQKLRYGQGQVNLDKFSDVDWDLVIIDEAHEGTQTELSSIIFNHVIKDKTKLLELSGTPFNLLDQYEDEQVYTWDYVMEQRAKLEWKLAHPDEPNPYEKLPEVNMFTFEMKDKAKFADESKSFNFREFFRVDDKGLLVYEADVRKFLDNITNYDDKTQYPFSTKHYREQLRHTLWLLPGVKEANAFEDLLKKHPIFGKEYKIVNVVRGTSSDNGIASQDDLDKVRQAIGSDPSETKTITLTVRKLTTGVNVPEWTAVLFLSNTNSAMNYLQAAFRAQTPFSHEKLGMKKECFVFDFAPDRALTVMAESAQINSGVGKKNTQQQKDAMTSLLNFMPILSSTDNGMQTYDVDKMLVQLKKVYAEKAVRSGFEDDSLYNDNLLMLDADAVATFNNLKGIVGTTGKQGKQKIVVNENDLTDEEYDRGERAKKKPARERTPEEKEAIEKIKQAQKDRKALISILRGVSIRIPMMIYGMSVDLNQDITIKDFINHVDEKSWQEFMPKGFTKGMFREIQKYYDPQVFIEAGRIIRNKAKSYDKLDVLTRAERIAELFATFKNPDKETVLTPWRVVNMQLVKTLGGLNFYDDNFSRTTTNAISNLHWVEQPETDTVYRKDAKILDINAKTGLYPLHVALSLYYQKVEANTDPHFEADKVYQDILRENVYAIAKTPMAKTITERTLAGYKPLETNVHYIEDFSNLIKQDTQKGQEKIKEAFGNVKFDVVVGNPPYQENKEGTSDNPIYHHFYDLAKEIADQYCLISPARFLFNAGKTPKAWNEEMLNDDHISVEYYEQKSYKVFPNTDIKGGIAVLYRNKNKTFEPIETFTAFNELTEIYKLVYHSKDFESLSNQVFAPESYKLTNKLHEDFPDIETRLSKGHKFDVTTNIFEKLPEIFTDTKNDDSVKILGRLNNERTYKFVSKDYITGPDNFKNYKVFLPKANGSGAIGEVLSTPLVGTPLVGTPLVGHTQTFISIGNFETRLEAENLLKYIKTHFARLLLGVLKITQDNKKSVWKYVPMQDFTEKSDVPWHLSIPEIDEYLYQKYHFQGEHKVFSRERISDM